MKRNTISLAIVSTLAISYVTFSISNEANTNQTSVKSVENAPTAPTSASTKNYLQADAIKSDSSAKHASQQPESTSPESRYSANQAKSFFTQNKSIPLKRGENIFIASSDKSPLHATTADDAKNMLLEGGSHYLSVRPSDDLSLKTAKRDQLGNVIYKYSQTYKEIKVFGHEVVVQINDQDEVTMIGGQYEPAIELDTTPLLSPRDAIDNAFLHFEDLPTNTPELISETSLMVYADGDNAPLLTYVTDIEYLAGSGYKKEKIFVDANTGLLVNSYSLMQSSFSYSIHSMNNQCLSQNGSGLPGTQINKDDGEHAAGVDANSAHAYYFYKHMFNRDSWDGNGVKTVSTIHARFQGSNGNCHSDNAYFTGDQLIFGDGDTNLNNPGAAIDIFGHEFSHGFTSAESNLTYQNESGAINEAMSDIMGTGVSIWKNSGGSSTGNPDSLNPVATDWDMGEDAALTQSWERHMDDPAENGQSIDNYPDRNTGSSDNGGVHTNSGIMNLAFYLLSQGGTHPRDKSTVVVNGIGAEKALQIYYYANNNLFTSSTNFSSARQKVATAAKTLYGCDEWESVHQSYDAVNVTGTRGDECDSNGDGNTGGDTGGDTGGSTGGDPTPPADNNIAAGSAYQASSTYNRWSYPVQNSTDEIATSYWVSQNIYNPSTEEYVMMNLGSSKSFSTLDISWGGSDAAGNISVLIWKNGRWIPVASASGAPATSISFEQQQAQYVLLTMKNGYFRRWYAISEISIH